MGWPAGAIPTERKIKASFHLARQRAPIFLRCRLQLPPRLGRNADREYRPFFPAERPTSLRHDPQPNYRMTRCDMTASHSQGRNGNRLAWIGGDRDEQKIGGQRGALHRKRPRAWAPAAGVRAPKLVRGS